MLNPTLMILLVNLTFLKSFGKDWQIFQLVKGSQIKIQDQMPTIVTHFLAHSTQIESAYNPHKWIVDSVANTYITSFKNTLHNYIEFPQSRSKNSVESKRMLMHKVLSY